jgi:hypothetical protein
VFTPDEVPFLWKEKEMTLFFKKSGDEGKKEEGNRWMTISNLCARSEFKIVLSSPLHSSPLPPLELHSLTNK